MPKGAVGKLRKRASAGAAKQVKGRGEKPEASVLRHDGRANTGTPFGPGERPFKPYYETPAGFVHPGKA